MGRASGETPLAYSAVRGGLWVALSTYWTLAFGFVANILLTRLLPPEAFGTFALAMFFAQLLRLEPKLGLSQAFGQHKDSGEEAIGTYLGLDIPVILAGVVLTGLAVPILIRLGYDPLVVQVMLVLALAAALESIGGLAGVMLDKRMRFDLTSLLVIVAFPFSYLPAFWLAIHGGGVWSLVSQTLVYSALLGLGLWWIAYRQLPDIRALRWRFSRFLAWRFVRFGITVGAAALATLLLTQLDNFLIGTLVGVTVLGFYDRAYRTAQWPSTLLTNAIARTAFYTYARLQADLPRLRKAVAMVSWIVILLSWPIALIIFVTAPDLIRLLYGERWLPSLVYLRLLVIIAAAKPVWDNATVLFTAIGKPGLSLRLITAQVGVLVALGVPLTWIWGGVGTCVAVGFAFAIGLLGAYIYLRREIGFRLDISMLIPILVSALTVLASMLLNRMTDIQTFSVPLRVVVKAFWVLLFYFGLNFMLQPRLMLERLGYVWRLGLRGQLS